MHCAKLCTIGMGRAWGRKADSWLAQQTTGARRAAVGVLETDGDRAVKGRYLRGVGLVCQRIDGDDWYYTHNAHGDVVQRIFAANGAATPKYEYDAFGNERKRVSAGTQATDGLDTDPNPFRYCGEYFDGETGEYYLRARMYNPGNGRFSSENGIRSGQNWYAYCRNDPIQYQDPSGNVPWRGGVPQTV